MRCAISVAMAAAILSACAAPPRWYLGGRTQAEFEAHDRQCADQASQGDPGEGAATSVGESRSAGLAAVFVAMEVSSYGARRKACMEAFGYRAAPN